VSTTQITQMLEAALAALRQEFPDAKLHEARLEFRLGERHGETHGTAKSWNEMAWTVQVNNDREYAESLEEALAMLRTMLARKAQVPALAARLTTILREIPDEGFTRDNVISAARDMLERERVPR